MDEALITRYCDRIREHMMFGEFKPQSEQDEFWAWLTNGVNCPEKDAAMYRMFELFMNSGMLLPEEDEIMQKEEIMHRRAMMVT